MAHAVHSSPNVGVCSSLRNEMDLRAGLAPASAVYETAASLPMLAENKNGVGLRSCPSAIKSPHALAPRLPTFGISPPGQLVLVRGNAPRSIGYQPIALLLSYARVMGNRRRAEVLRPNRQGRSDCVRNSARALAGSLSMKKWRRAVVLPHRPDGPGRLPTGRRAPRLYSPTKKIKRRPEVMLPSGVRPPWPLQTVAGALAGLASENLRGRNCTCVEPLRRRRPDLLGYAEESGGSGRSCTSTVPRSKRG